MPYFFKPDPERPTERINIVDSSNGRVLLWLPPAVAQQVAMVYSTTIERGGLSAADDFIFGYSMGMGHATLYGDQLPRAVITETDDGQVLMSMRDPDGTETEPVPVDQVPGAALATSEILEHMGIRRQ